jgi:hypothetical protein
MNRESLTAKGKMEQTITLIKSQIIKIKEMQILQNQTLEILIDKVHQLEGEEPFFNKESDEGQLDYYL